MESRTLSVADITDERAQPEEIDINDLIHELRNGFKEIDDSQGSELFSVIYQDTGYWEEVRRKHQEKYVDEATTLILMMTHHKLGISIQLQKSYYGAMKIQALSVMRKISSIIRECFKQALNGVENGQ